MRIENPLKVSQIFLFYFTPDSELHNFQINPFLIPQREKKLSYLKGSIISKVGQKKKKKISSESLFSTAFKNRVTLSPTLYKTRSYNPPIIHVLSPHAVS